MADNRYSVDDILNELNSKKQRDFSNQPTAEQSAPQWSPRTERTEAAPRRPSAPPQEDSDDFWEMKKPAPRRAPAEPPAGRHMREPQSAAQSEQRLGQTMPPPRSRREMDKLLNRFDDSKSDNSFDDFDFLQREPEQAYDNTAVKSFVPDWDKQPQRQPERQRNVQEDRRREAPPQREYRQAAPPPQSGRSYSGQQHLQQGGRETSKMYAEDRRSMANAARLITSGGFEDDQSTPPPQTQRSRQRPPVRTQDTRPIRREAPQYNDEFTQPIRREAPQYNDEFTQPIRREAPQYNDEFTQPMRREAPRYRDDRQATQQIPQSRMQRTQPLTPAAQPKSDIDDIFGEEVRTETAAATEQNTERTREGTKRDGNRQIAAQLEKMKVSLFIRVVVNLFALVGVVYLSLAGAYDFPLPSFIAGEGNMGLFLWSTVALVIISALVSGNTVGGGILALLKLTPSNDSYSALAVFACLIQGSYMAMQPQLMTDYGDNLYLPMAALMLLFNTLGKLILLSRMEGSFHFAASKGDKHIADVMDNREFARRISGDIVGDEPRIAYFTDAAAVDGFMEQAFSESKAEDISKVVAPVTALAALVMALVSYLFSRDIFIAACVYTAALCITAPLAGVIASNLPLSITNGKLARFGASLCGYEAVNRFSETNGVLLRCSQLFPKGSVSIKDIKVLDRRPIDQVIIDAASVLCACDSNLSDIFRDMVQDSSMLHEPENLEYVDDMGLSAWVNGRRVLIGNRSLMMSYGVSIPGVDFERPYTTGNNEVLYLANSGEAAAMYVLTYKADKQMRRAMELLCDRDMAICLYSTDPNLTVEKISEIYKFPKELLSIIPASMQAGSEKYLMPKGREKASVVHNGLPASYLRTILAAQSCSKCITLETALILMSVGLGFLIVTFFAFTQQMETLTWVTLAVYQFFWLLLELVVPLIKH